MAPPPAAPAPAGGGILQLEVARRVAAAAAAATIQEVHSRCARGVRYAQAGGRRRRADVASRSRAARCSARRGSWRHAAKCGVCLCCCCEVVWQCGAPTATLRRFSKRNSKKIEKRPICTGWTARPAVPQPANTFGLLGCLPNNAGWPQLGNKMRPCMAASTAYAGSWSRA